MLGPVSHARRRSAVLAAALVGMLAAAGALAEVYKSVDADGNVVFSQKPPPGVKAETVKPRYTRPPGAAKSAGTGAQSKPSAPPATVIVPADGKQKLSPEQLAIKAKNCENARSQIKQLTAPRANRLQYRDDKGELAFYTEDQRNEGIQAAEKAAKEFCE